MEELHVAYAVLGVVAVVLALVSRSIRRLPVTEPLVALVLGVVLGPRVLGLVTVSEPLRDVLLLEGSRLLLAWSVMAAALRFPAARLRPLLRQVVVLVVVVMPVAAVVSAAAAWLLALPLALALLVGACLCPTDPVLAASVVSGEPAERDIPSRLRRLLTAESGSNDGLALPIVVSALTLVLGHEVGGVVPRLVWEVVGGTLVGVAAGALAGVGIRLATRERSLARGPELVFTLLLAIAVLGVARAAGTDGVLSVFVAGIAYNRAVGEGELGPQEDVDEAVNRYAVLPFFAVLGAVLPWAAWAGLGWAGVAFVAVVLVLRRLPAVLLLRRPLGLGGREALFVGWFGPMGVSAVFYLMHSIHEGAAAPELFAAGTLAVAASVVVFGVTAAPGRVLYARSGAPADDHDPGPTEARRA